MAWPAPSTRCRYTAVAQPLTHARRRAVHVRRRRALVLGGPRCAPRCQRLRRRRAEPLGRGQGWRGEHRPPRRERRHARAGYAISTLRGDSLVLGRGDAVVLLNVWATWCASCKEEFAFMDTLLARYGASGLRVVAVSVDVGSSAPVERVARQYGVTFEVAHDPEGRVERLFPAMGVPASYLIGRDGLVRWARTRRAAPVGRLRHRCRCRAGRGHRLGTPGAPAAATMLAATDVGF